MKGLQDLKVIHYCYAHLCLASLEVEDRSLSFPVSVFLFFFLFLCTNKVEIKINVL